MQAKMAQIFAEIPRVGADVIEIPPAELILSKARGTASLLLSGAMKWVWPRSFHKHVSADNDLLAETIVFDTEVELPQRPAFPIETVERVAVTFQRDDKRYPGVYALRPEFPLVAHINLESFEIPRSLCLFDEPYEELTLTWTDVGLIERIRTWLADTAAGKLHQAGQPLEPLLNSPDALIIFPPNFLGSLSSESPPPIKLDANIWDNGKICFAPADGRARAGQPGPHDFLVMPVKGKWQEHGHITRKPQTLNDLQAFLEAAEIDLLGGLRQTLRGFIDGGLTADQEALNSGLILLFFLPKTRDADAAPETTDIYGFVLVRKDRLTGSFFPLVRDIGEWLGVWDIHNGSAGLLLAPDTSRTGDEVELLMLSPTYPLSRQSAPAFAGTGERIDKKLVAIGMGALGSQIFINLIRTADGDWTTIDKDVLLPHNFVRHAAYGSAAGIAKASFSTMVANATIEGPPMSKAIVADVLDPGDNEAEIDGAYHEADAIFDFSASRAVARYLALDVPASARRISAFLNPSGNDLVILAEDRKRSTTLEQLEMQYYRLLINEAPLSDHLKPTHGQTGFSASCRAVSSQILPDSVARAASIASSALRNIVNDDEAAIIIWRGESNGEVKRFSARACSGLSSRVGEWIVSTDECVLERIRAERVKRLPVETGGVLIGSYDMKRKIIYVADYLSAPEDSTEEKTHFIRGSFGLPAAVERIQKVTLNNLGYIGDWHSHPNGHGATPSADDRLLVRALADQHRKDGKPAIILIVGDANQYSWNLKE